MIHAVLFDVDGTLLDTEGYIFGAFDAALASAGLPGAPADVYRQVVGHPLEECYRLLAPGVDEQALCAAHRGWQLRHLEMVKPMPGALDVLARLKADGLRLAAVTNRARPSSLASLGRAGLLSNLDLVISADDVTRQKPDAEPVLVALRALEIPPSRAVMVGDTLVDIAAGRAAGVRTVAVSFGFGGASIAQEADALLHRLGELPRLLAGW